MKILLDTTYLLPVIGIAIKELQKNTLTKLLVKEHQISISQISLFELSAKGAKYVNSNLLEPNRIIRGIQAIQHDDAITAIPIYDTSLLLTSFKLRSVLPDFIDCLILSTAVNHCDALITEDTSVQNLQANKEIKHILTKTNPAFQILSSTQILQS